MEIGNKTPWKPIIPFLSDHNDFLSRKKFLLVDLHSHHLNVFLIIVIYSINSIIVSVLPHRPTVHRTLFLSQQRTEPQLQVWTAVELTPKRNQTSISRTIPTTKLSISRLGP